MKSASDILDAINELERDFPVHRWRAGDVDLWPVYRIRLFMDITFAILEPAPATTAADRMAGLAKRASRALWRVALASLRNGAMNAKLEPDTRAVFLSDGLSFTRVGDQWCDRIVDPFQIALQERGLRSLKLTPLAEVHVPRLVPSRFVQPTIDCVKLLARPGRLRVELEGFEAFLDVARARFGRYPQSGEWLALQAARLDRLARWFGKILQRCGARHAFVNNYYSLEGMSFVLAARRLGIFSADLQHGLQGSEHGAYGRWGSVPDDGYSTLPDEFWVWSADEAAAIDTWRGNRPIHRPRVTGNLWRERWLDDTDPQVAAFLREARALRGDGTRARVLVCLGWGLAKEETNKLIRAAQLCGPTVAWWWRLHPVEARRCDEFATRLAREGLDASQVAAATDLPLYALVRTADMVVAHSSTVIHEAALFGVPSIVTSAFGAEIHAALVQRGTTLQANTAEAVVRAVQALTGNVRKAMPLPVAPRTNVQRLFDELFAAAPTAKSCRGAVRP